jgi:hypothetical protein
MTDGSRLIRIQREGGEHGEACLDTSGDLINWKSDGDYQWKEFRGIAAGRAVVRCLLPIDDGVETYTDKP